MKRETVVIRARSALGQGCKYALGRGGKNPLKAVPWDDEQECDCSGFAMWALGLSRFDAESGLWYDTSRIYREAVAGNNWFTRMEWRNALPADLIVYPDRRGTDGVLHHGHVGVVTEVTAEKGPTMIVDCSAGNWKRHSDAIREGPPDPFTGNDFAIVASYARFVEAIA